MCFVAFRKTVSDNLWESCGGEARMSADYASVILSAAP
jgi:hypothetical protein